MSAENAYITPHNQQRIVTPLVMAYVQPQHQLMDHGAASLFLDLSAGTLYLHFFTIFSLLSGQFCRQLKIFLFYEADGPAPS